MLGQAYIRRKSLMKFSIQIDYTARDDDGKPFRARSTFQCEARSLPEAYLLAKNSDWEEGMKPIKFGVIMPGWHILIGDKLTPEIAKQMAREEKEFEKRKATMVDSLAQRIVDLQK